MSAYADVEKIGSGGFGKIMRCKHDPSGEQFAKKVLTSDDKNSVARFKKEVRILASLDHPNIAIVRADSPAFGSEAQGLRAFSGLQEGFVKLA